MVDQAAPPRSFGDSGAGELEYRPVSGLAVLGLVLGVLSVGAFLAPALWGLAGLAAAINLVAWRRIAASGAPMLGMRAAILGLCLSATFGVGAVSEHLMTRWIIFHQGDQFARRWFQLLGNDQLHLAARLEMDPQTRRSAPETDINNPLDAQAVETFSPLEAGHQPVVKRLLALGRRARVEYLDTAELRTGAAGDNLVVIYRVTYEEPEGEQTFDVEMAMSRDRSVSPAAAGWRVQSVVTAQPPRRTE